MARGLLAVAALAIAACGNDTGSNPGNTDPWISPTNGHYTNTGSDACGGVVLSFQVGSTPYLYAAASPNDCNGGVTSGSAIGGGSFDLNLGSVSILDATGNVVGAGSGTGSWAYYKVTGSLNATLVDTRSPTSPAVSLSLTF